MSLAALGLLLLPPNLPDIAPGTAQWFQKGSIECQRALHQGNFAKAANLAAHLPDLNLRLSYNDSLVPAAKRASFKAAAQAAATMWQEKIEGLKVNWAKENPDVQVSFSKQLPVPKGAAFLTSYSPVDPSVEAVIGLVRGRNAAPAIDRDVYNEVLYGIGLHFGLLEMPGLGSAANRSDESYGMRQSVTGINRQIVLNNLNIASVLQQLAKEKVSITPIEPQIFVDPQRYEAQAVQGDVLKWSIAITNKGKGKLTYNVVPDCGCFRIYMGKDVEPGQTVAVPVEIYTADFPGSHNKKLFIYSNDPDVPVRELPVHFYAEPMFRVLTKQPGDTYQITGEGFIAKAYLVINPKKPIGIKRVGVSGLEAAVEFKEWKGVIADPEMGDAARERVGYEITMMFSGDLPGSRSPATLAIEPTDESLPVIFKSFYLQKGIAVASELLYLGNIGKSAITTSTMVIREDKAFKILGVKTDSPLLTARIESIREGHQYRLVVHYKGGAPIGLWSSKITLTTDDPQQKTITVEVTGNAQ